MVAGVVGAVVALVGDGADVAVGAAETCIDEGTGAGALNRPFAGPVVTAPGCS